MERIFHLKENGTTVKTEILAGLTTFMTMAYIIALNPNLLTGFQTGTPLWNGVFLATCIASAIGTVCMAFLANKPFVMAPAWPEQLLRRGGGQRGRYAEHRLHQRLPGGTVHHPGGGHRVPAAERVQHP